MDNDKLKYWLALKSIPGVGNSAFPALLNCFGSPQNVFSASPAQLHNVKAITKKTAADIAGFKKWDYIEKSLEFLENAGMQIITYQDEFYPAKLLEIDDRPPLIYACGTLKKTDLNISIVGSRLASTYGQYTTGKIARELALRGMTVVSGLARGIDSAAHRGALSAQGRTIAVLGSGLDIIYPPENKDLYAEIRQSGAVISEYPPGTPPRAANFPARNRIISGISYGVVVVEAGEKSGSLITARLALEQGREVFAVPGSIDAAGSKGTNRLIKQGAKLIENIDDILEEILPQIEKIKIPAALSVPGAEKCSAERDGNNETFNAAEQQIIGLLSNKHVHIDELINATGSPPNDILSSLLMLELKGIVKQHPGKFFSLA